MSARLMTRPTGHCIKNASNAPYIERLKSTAKVMFDVLHAAGPPEVVDFFRASLHENINNLLAQTKATDEAISGMVKDMMRKLKRARQLGENDKIPFAQGYGISKALGVSRRTFQNYCQTVTGMPPTTFVREIRMTNVRRRLEKSCETDGVLDSAILSQFFHDGRFSNTITRNLENTRATLVFQTSDACPYSSFSRD